MHYKNNKINILCFTENDFSNSLEELKEHLNFNLIFRKNNQTEGEQDNFDGVLIHENMLKDDVVLKFLKKVNSISPNLKRS